MLARKQKQQTGPETEGSEAELEELKDISNAEGKILLELLLSYCLTFLSENSLNFDFLSAFGVTNMMKNSIFSDFNCIDKCCSCF